MRTLAATVNPTEVGRLIGLGALLRHFSSLVLVAMIVALGLIFSIAKFDGQFLQLDSKSSAISLHSSENIIQEHYVISEDDDPAFNHSRKILEHSFTVIPVLVITLLLSPHLDSIFDAIDSSPYIKSFASIPLRSPPLFS